MRTCPLAIDLAKELKQRGFGVHRVWLAPRDNPDGHLDIVLCGGVAIHFDCRANTGSVLRFVNVRDMTYYPYRGTAAEILHDIDEAFTTQVVAGHRNTCQHDYAIGFEELAEATHG